MAETAANLDETMPPVPLRQWVLTVPYPVRYRLAYNGKLLGRVCRIFLDTVLAFYNKKQRGLGEGQRGCIAVVQRCSSELRCNRHIHAVFLDGVYWPGEAPTFAALSKLTHEDVAAVLARIGKRTDKLLAKSTCDAEPSVLLASVAGVPPAGPSWKEGSEPSWQKAHSSASRDLVTTQEGYSLHAQTRAGAEDAKGRLALDKYILRPPIAQERVQMRHDGLVQIALKKKFSDGTYAVALDPLSLLTRRPPSSGCRRQTARMG